jgi:hypothetical protein
MDLDPTIVALRRFEAAELAYTTFTGNLLDSRAEITQSAREEAAALRDALDRARRQYHEALRESGRLVPFTH